LAASSLKLMAFGIALTLGGCATRPENIPAAYVSPEQYAQYSCAQLKTVMTEAKALMDKFSAIQTGKANSDALTVIFVPIPPTKLSGDYAADVAKYKGEVQAIESVQKKKGCIKSAWYNSFSNSMRY